ncbi:DUF1361 domain-containing protein [Vallitalea okinawensis]|uniref:DUF1361 domain-containing protein n=1 Tax=Vallitalea okinawensis TaxID=2078660 RepID=UPI000CFD2B51|nr:DUF1361 domain-containing protein [Vallitalea okinawensis]
MKNKFYDQFKFMSSLLLFFSIVSSVIIASRYMFFDDRSLMFLIWNIFLSWVPYIISLIIYRRKMIIKRGRSWVNHLLTLMWLFFYPNTLYIITDALHIKSRVDYYFNNDIVVMDNGGWLKFWLLIFVILLGFIMGIISLYAMQNILDSNYGPLFSWGFVAIVMVLSSYAIYIGRYLRLNSWDILNPIKLFNNVIQTLHMDMLSFVGLFTMMLLCVYVLFYNLISLRKGA